MAAPGMALTLPMLVPEQELERDRPFRIGREPARRIVDRRIGAARREHCRERSDKGPGVRLRTWANLTLGARLAGRFGANQRHRDLFDHIIGASEQVHRNKPRS